MTGFGAVLRSAFATVAALSVLILAAPYGLAQLFDVGIGSYLLWVIAVGLVAFVGGLFIGGGETTMELGTGIALGTIAFYVPFGMWLGNSISDTFA
jgi:hypothetical protein